MRTNTVGTAFRLVSDATASAGKYLETVKQTTSAPTDSIYMLTTTFKVAKAGTYYIHGRVKCPSYDDDSYYWGIDESLDNNRFANGIVTSGWEWKNIGNKTLKAGQHKLVIGGREDGASIDKLCITTNSEAPTGMGGKSTTTAIRNQGCKARCDTPVEIYSMSGVRQTSKQVPGIYIAVSHKADGTIESHKVISQ